MRKFKFSAVVAAFVTAITGTAFVACGRSSVPEGFTEITYYASQVTAESRGAYTEMVDTYNSTQGQIDKVSVRLQLSTGDISANLIIGKPGSAVNVVTVANTANQFKTIVTRGNNFVDLEPYLDEKAKNTLDWDQIPDSSKNMWRFRSALEDGKYRAGEGAHLLAMPFGNDPQVLFYNTEIFKAMGINIVSVNEELCGKGAYAKLAAHGYAEYAQAYGAPVDGMRTSLNSAGQTVYKVFNNRVPMNWEEQRILARDFQTYKSGGDAYGYMSEWWFNYCWSVGGDCIGWDADSKAYKMTFDDKTSNYLALETIEVNGTTYTQGEAIDYEDKVWLQDNWEEAEKTGKVTALPSTYEAFLEFNRLGVPKTQFIEDGISGYGVAPPTTAQRQGKFTSGESPMLNEYYSNVNDFRGSAVTGKFDIAPLCQYRAYADGSTYQKDGTKGFAHEYLKVIGEKYDNRVYTGALKTVTSASGTEVPVMGEAITCVNTKVSALAIPVNSDPEKYAASFRFISWACGPEGQKIVSKGNTLVPNQMDAGLSDAFSEDENRACDNAYAASFGNVNSYMGDWSYFNGDTWIVGWSAPLNSDVRQGKMKLQTFFDGYTEKANTALKPMKIYMKRT